MAAPAHNRRPAQAAVDVISDFLTDRCGVLPHYARLTALELMDRLHADGWEFHTDNSKLMYVWAWLYEHGLAVRDQDLTDPDLRVTVDLDAC